MRYSRFPFCFIFAALLISTRLSADSPKTDDTAEVSRLRAELRRHDELYFKKAAPEISDADYDRLKQRLAKLEGPRDEADAFGDDRTEKLPHRAHLVPMSGLTKTYSKEELREFLSRIANRLPGETTAYVIEPKYDGIAVSVTYENGVLTRAVTRGDGASGDEVTSAMLALTDIPRQLKSDTGSRFVLPATVELRGEVFMTHAEFERINRARKAAGEEPFANPRNLAVGTLKSTGDAASAKRRLTAVFYGYGAWSPENSHPTSQLELVARLESYGLPHPPATSAETGFNAVWKCVTDIARDRKKLPYPIDGAVVKVDTIAQRKKLGEGTGAPRWTVACKFDAERASTRLRAITFTVGRTGALTPVAEFEAITLGGATVRRASLHNPGEIARLDLRLGDLITVEKAGDIIPVVTGVDHAARDAKSVAFVVPTHCPECATALTILDGAVCCANDGCAVQLRRKLEHFAAKESVGISGLGPALVEKLVAAKLVRTPADFYLLKKEDLTTLPGVGEKSAERLLAAISQSKNAEPWRFISGLGIPEIGPGAAKKIAAKFGTLRAFSEATPEAIAALPLGAPAIRELSRHLADPARRAVIAALANSGCGGPKKEKGGE
jgi:DNA ligase (NAD+)